jgi:thiosulfate/3-mercaptopyruvate sulfurtransferase
MSYRKDSRRQSDKTRRKGRLQAMLMTMSGWLGVWLMSSGCFAVMGVPATAPYTSQRGWIISPKEAMTRIAKGAVVWDTREAKDYNKGHIKGALHTTWQHFSQSKAPNQGKLLTSDSTLNSKIRALGISPNTDLIVYANPAQGWGEEGRIVWMMRSFGHTKAVFVDGGYQALLDAGAAKSTNKPPAPKAGTFVIKRNATWSVDRPQLQSLVSKKSFASSMVLVDTRELREYQGGTPYGESRGGHVPEAKHLYFKDLVNAVGKLLPRATLLSRLAQKGIVPSKPVVAYCTGGIRSGWFVALLYDLGFKDVKNYAGSMWEWASQPANSHPLVKSTTK